MRSIWSWSRSSNEMLSGFQGSRRASSSRQALTAAAAGPGTPSSAQRRTLRTDTPSNIAASPSERRRNERCSANSVCVIMARLYTIPTKSAMTLCPLVMTNRHHRYIGARLRPRRGSALWLCLHRAAWSCRASLSVAQGQSTRLPVGVESVAAPYDDADAFSAIRQARRSLDRCRWVTKSTASWVVRCDVLAIFDIVMIL